MAKAPLVLPLAVLAGCASGPYHRSYRAIPSAPAAFAPCAADPVVEIPDDPQAAGQELEKHGYVAIGFSTFSSTVPDPAHDPALLRQARKVGACRVLLSYDRAGNRRVGIGIEEREEAAFEVSAIYFAKPR